MAAAPKRAKRDVDLESEHDDQGGEDEHTNHSTYEDDEDDEEVKAFLDEERARLSALLEALSGEELRRYEAARRCSLNAKDVKQTVETVLGKHAKGAAEKALMATGVDVPTVDDKTIVAVNGLAKLFLRELIETACIVADERDHALRIQPRHLREAHRRLKKAGKLPTMSSILN